MSPRDTVTIGVPIYRGEAFLGETLRSIQAQTHKDFEVILSVDGSQPECEELCRPFLSDPRFRLVVQAERLGWVRNIDWLMTQVKTPFWCYQAQDDLMDPRYLEALVEGARRWPAAAVVYSDIEPFGSESGRLTQESVVGEPVARQLALLYRHRAAVAFGGLTRLPALQMAGGVWPNAAEDFSADTTWMAGAARWGELRRVPAALLRKRYHSQATHLNWAAWPYERRARAWVIHCADMLERAMPVEASSRDRSAIWFAAVFRLAAGRPVCGFLPLRRMTAADRRSLVRDLLHHVREERGLDMPAWLGASWESIEESTRGVRWSPLWFGWAGRVDIVRRSRQLARANSRC